MKKIKIESIAKIENDFLVLVSICKKEYISTEEFIIPINYKSMA